MELTTEDDLEGEIERADIYSEDIRRSLLTIERALRPPPPRLDLPPATPPPRPDPPPTTPPPRLDPPPTVPPPHHDPTPAHVDPIPDPAGTTHGHGDDVQTVATSKVKLPKLVLLHFKGNPIYWTAF